MAINWSDYEDVATLNKWFVANYPMGGLRIIDKDHKLIMNKDGHVIDEIFIVTTGVYRDANDSNPAIMNVARGRQSEYPKHMQRFYAEDVTTSSYGRCLTLLKASDKTATQDDMKKVEIGNAEPVKPIYGRQGSRSAIVEMALRKGITVNEPFEAPVINEPAPMQWSVDEVVDAIGASIPNEPPPCCTAGHKLKEGISKGGKPYYGYVCNANIKEHAQWASLTSNGKWYFKGDE